jgi:hypothetical protein
MTKTNYKPFGILSILAGITATFGTVSVLPAVFAAPTAIISGIIAIRKGHKMLGWIGIGLSLLAVVATLGLLYYYGWFDGSKTSND